jgi:predicted RNA-binding protein with PUA-like domain
MPTRNYWLVKSEADVFSFDDLLAAPNRTTGWDGVRNYAARNHLRAMRNGDLVLFYYSMESDKAIVGVATVVREAYPDATALDPADPHYDAKSDPAEPRWFMVDLQAAERLPRPVRLEEIKRTKGLENMALLRIGRLSVQPVTDAEFAIIRGLADSPAAPTQKAKSKAVKAKPAKTKTKPKTKAKAKPAAKRKR